MTDASPVTKQQVFKRHAKVVAAVDLPHVPAGTPGRVLYVAGVTWIRYHVLFDNGESLSSLDATQLTDRDEWDTDAVRATPSRAASPAGRRTGA